MFRHVLGVLGLALLGATVLSLTAVSPAGDKEKRGQDKGAQHHHEMFLKCAEACSRCQKECDVCAHYCIKLVAEGKKDHVRTLRTCQDCANVCATAAQIVARQGPFAGLICRACAEACARCGKACEQFSDDPHMRRCAEECRRCEHACREMVAQMERAEEHGVTQKKG